MKHLTFTLLFFLLTISAAAQNMDRKLLLIEYPVINIADRPLKWIDAKTYEGKMNMDDYSQTTGELLDSEKTNYTKNGTISSKESERKSLDQKRILKVHNNTNFSVTQKQGKHASTTTTELKERTDSTALYAIEEIGVGTTYKTKELYKNCVITTTQDQHRLILSVDTIEYNKEGYPVFQITDARADKRRIEYKHKYNENGWLTITSIKTINYLKNREGEDVEETTTFNQHYRYVHEDKFHNWLTRYAFNQNNKLINITIRRIDYY